MTHEPQRMCVCCREKFPQRSLIRITRYNGEFSVSIGSVSNGRSAYFCGKESCLKKFVKSKALDRAFKERVPESVYLKVTELSSTLGEAVNDE